MKATYKNRKHRKYCRVRRFAYPNAADKAYFEEKLLDGVTSVVTCLGILTILFFLITM